MKVLHSWLQDYVGPALPDAAAVAELLTFHAFEIDSVTTVADDAVLDVDVLPNRAADALSHRGIARELGTILSAPLVYDPLREQIAVTKTDRVTVDIADAAACPRFTAAVITGVTVQESPEWLQERLRVVGQRPINNLVDATNYVMYALGQPLHVYDADKFPAAHHTWQFSIRYARPDETIELLAEGEHGTDRTVTLTGTELIIAEGSSDTPIGLAGVKGGRFAEVHAGTKNIIIEAAHFDPVLIRQTARRLGIVTDASKRFENAPSRELPLYAQREIGQLILEIAGGEQGGVVDAYPNSIAATPVMVTLEKVNSRLGLSLTATEVQALCKRLGATVEESAADQFLVTAPWERTDLVIEEDYIEEVGRLHGLSNIQAVLPEVVPLREINKRQYYSDRMRTALVQAGFSEVITTTFQKKGDIQLQNALASDKRYVRQTLQKNITAVLDANSVHTDLLGLPAVRVFEIGTVFKRSETGITEHLSLALGARTKGNGYSPKDDALLSEGCAAIQTALGVELPWEGAAGTAELNVSAVLPELPTPQAYEPLPEMPTVTYAPISPYPAVARDIALFVTGNETPEEVQAVLRATAGELCVRQTLFDTFSKEGRTSYAFRLVFLSHVKTLTDSEVNTIMERVYTGAAERGWEVR